VYEGHQLRGLPAGLFEKLLVLLLDVQSFLDAATNAVAYHQAGEPVAVDELAGSPGVRSG
jgi:hypothetical protein